MSNNVVNNSVIQNLSKSPPNASTEMNNPKTTILKGGKRKRKTKKRKTNKRKYKLRR